MKLKRYDYLANKRKINGGELMDTLAIILSFGLFIFTLVVIALCIYRPINKVVNKREVTVTVTEKAVKNGGESGKYLIYTEDEEGNIAVYEITDSLLAFRFDSSDVYAAIK